MQFGRFEIYQLSDGLFRLGGSMMEEFSGDPSEEESKPEPGRLLVSINVVVVKDRENIILCDTGIGTKHRDQPCDYPAPDDRAKSVREQLPYLGIQPEDVTHIFMTHLHYDHAGGLTCFDEERNLIVTYPNAQVFVQDEEWQAGQQAAYKSSKGYRSENWGVYQDSSWLQIIDGDEQIIDGISLQKTNGHTRGHQIVKIDAGNGSIAGVFGDVIPTPSHFVKGLKMKFDYDPEKSKSERTKLVEQALAEDWLLFFYHAPHVKAGKGYVKADATVKVKKFENSELWPDIH